MHIIKIYETTLNITAKEMYFDLDKVIMDKLREKYEGKCEKDSLIVKILGIDKKSFCRLSKSRLDGSGNIDLQFRAEAVVYNNDDILTGCEIQKIEKGNKIICKHEIAVVNIKGNKNLQSLQPKQKITNKIETISYLKGVDKITIYGVPYSYSYKFTLYLTNFKSISRENVEILANKIKEIDSEREKYKSADKSSTKFFSNLYYPFKESFDSPEKKNLIKNSKVELVNIYDLARKIIGENDPEIKEKKSK